MTRVTAGALAALALLAGAAPAPASARPYTLEDLLAQEALGAVAVAPGGRWLVFERQGPYDRLPRYDAGYTSSEAYARLFVADLDRPGPARPLLPPDPRAGLTLGPFSPSGGQLVVYRLRDRTWDLGVVTLATGAVRWIDRTPQAAARGQTVQWRSEHQLLVIARPDRQAPADLRAGWAVSERLPAWWSAAARGDTAHTVVGSGIYANLRPRWPVRRLLQLDLLSGRETILAEGEFFDLELSPDRRQVALLASGPDVQSRPDGPVRGVAGSETEASRLTVLDLESGRLTAVCATCDVLSQLLAWSPDSRSLLAFVRGADGLWSSGRLMRVQAASGRMTDIMGRLQPALALNPVVVRAGWLGPDPVLYGRAPPDERADWHRLAAAGPVNLTRALPRPEPLIRAADAQHLVLSGGDGLWRTDRQGRAQRIGPPGARPALQDPRGSPGIRLANRFPAGSWVARPLDGAVRLSWLGPDGDTQDLASSTGAAQWFGPAGPAAALVRHDVDDHGVETLRAVRRQAAALAVATLNADLAAVDPIRVEPVHHVGDRGEPLTSWLFLPELPPGAPPPPLIVRPYLGYAYPTPPSDRRMEDGFLGNLRVLTGHGYAVLMPSLPNPPGGMTDPTARIGERILAIERAAREDPRLAGLFDPDREALLGWSFGGYTVMATLTQTDRFRAGVSISGISDMTAYWAHIAMGRAVTPEEGYGSNWSTGVVESTQPQMGAPPWSDPALYQRNSPLLQADRIRTPLLLIHGWRDTIPYAGSEAMYSALFRQGKDAQLVTYWAAEHRLVSPGDVRDAWARTFAFLDQHLQPQAEALTARPAASPGPAPASGAPRPPPPPH